MTGIIDYGAGNLRSLRFALDRLGAPSLISADPDRLRLADRIIFPGVGAAGFAMERLRSTGLDGLIREFPRPLLGICLGMQLLCAHSEEQDTECLGLFESRVARFRGAEKVPHTGWNTISGLSGKLFCGVDAGASVYFVHSFRAEVSTATAATTRYGGSFSAALARGNYFGVQFHPEKSGAVGEQILQNFLRL